MKTRSRNGEKLNSNENEYPTICGRKRKAAEGDEERARKAIKRMKTTEGSSSNGPMDETSPMSVGQSFNVPEESEKHAN